MAKALNSPEGIKHFLATVPSGIAQVLDRPPVSELIRSGAKKESIEACLSVQITKAASMLTVGGNLREGQALEIAIQLIADFPNESLEDFCLCLRRGIKGIYGQIFRFDVLVINEWFQKYLDEKYKAVENRLMDEKDNIYEVPDTSLPPDGLSDEARREKERDRLKAWMEAIKGADTKKIPPMDEKDIELEGKERPKAKYHPVTTLSQAQAHELHLEWIRQNFDKYTAEKLDGWKPEREWIDGLTDSEKQRIYKQAKL